MEWPTTGQAQPVSFESPSIDAVVSTLTQLVDTYARRPEYGGVELMQPHTNSDASVFVGFYFNGASGSTHLYVLRYYPATGEWFHGKHFVPDPISASRQALERIPIGREQEIREDPQSVSAFMRTSASAEILERSSRYERELLGYRA